LSETIGSFLVKEWHCSKNGRKRKWKMISDEVAEFKAIPVEAGQEVFMPDKFGHLVANTEKHIL